jgi:hypothetical protein
MAVSGDLSNVLDEAYEDKGLREILAPPPSATLAWLIERHNQMLSEVFGIQTVAERAATSTSHLLGRWSPSPTRSSTAGPLDPLPPWAFLPVHDQPAQPVQQ